MTPTVFETALRRDEGKGQPSRSVKQLSADALVFFAAGMSGPDSFHADQNLIWLFLAGTDTTAHCLATGTWHLLKNPEMLDVLRQELVNANPDKSSRVTVNWLALEKLPYLVGITYDPRYENPKVILY